MSTIPQVKDLKNHPDSSPDLAAESTPTVLLSEERKRQTFPCDICGSDNQSRHFELYVFGREGVTLCMRHQIQVGEFILQLTRKEMTTKRDAVLERKKREAVQP